jgi:hypothetical protein
MAAIGGLDPSVLVSPDYQVQMQQAERQRALAQALRAQSMQDTAGNGGSVSWTQGLLASLMRYRPTSATSAPTRRSSARTRLTRGHGEHVWPAADRPRSGPAAWPKERRQRLRAPPMPLRKRHSRLRAAGTPADPLAPQCAPASCPAAACRRSCRRRGAHLLMGPMNLTGDPRRDMGLYVMNPEEYGKAMIGNAAKGPRRPISK